jgi:hypothetical protein
MKVAAADCSNGVLLACWPDWYIGTKFVATMVVCGQWLRGGRLLAWCP